MKVPRRIKMYSPYAKKHTVHEVEIVKKKRASELARGQRLFRSFPRPKPEGREKPTKRVYVRYRCTETGKAHHRKNIRAKKFELTE